MPTITTPMRTISTAKSTSALMFNAMTDWMDMSAFTGGMFGIELRGNTNILCQPGVQFSNDGFTWDTAVGIDLASSPNQFTDAGGWTQMATFAMAPFGTTQRVLVRFGIMTKNKEGAEAENASARLRITFPDTQANSMDLASRLVPSRASTSLVNFVPYTEAITTASFTQFRASLLIEENTGAATVAVAHQTSMDGVTWGTTVAHGTYTGTEGFQFAGTFTTLVLNTVPFVRWGIAVKNSSGTATETAFVGLKLDLRMS